jgi:hypothetical protein
MIVLHIEHKVANFAGWKQAFDNDPVGRERLKVRRYRILRAVDDPNFVVIELEFDSVSDAEALLAAMQAVWGRVQGSLIDSPRTRIAELVETLEY